MGRISLVLDDEQIERLEHLASDSGPYDSKSEAARELMTECEELRTRCDELETETDRLRRQLRETNRRVDEHQELVRYVERERSLQERREQRMDAPAWTRAKYWLFGRSDS